MGMGFTYFHSYETSSNGLVLSTRHSTHNRRRFLPLRKSRWITKPTEYFLSWHSMLIIRSLSLCYPFQFPITALREIKFLEFLQHDNIIKLYNAFLYSQTSECMSIHAAISSLALNSVVPEVFLTFEYISCLFFPQHHFLHCFL